MFSLIGMGKKRGKKKEADSPLGGLKDPRKG